MSYYPDHTNYTGTDITGAGTGGSGGGDSVGGAPYGPEQADDDPANETVAEPINTLVHLFVYDKNGNIVPNQPGVTYYDPSQFSGIGGNPSISLNPIGFGSIVPVPGSITDGSQMPEVSTPEPLEQPAIHISTSLKEVLTNPESVSDARLLSAITELNNNAALVGLNIAAASLLMPGMGKAIIAGTWTGQ